MCWIKIFAIVVIIATPKQRIFWFLALWLTNLLVEKCNLLVRWVNFNLIQKSNLFRIAIQGNIQRIFGFLHQKKYKLFLQRPKTVHQHQRTFYLSLAKGLTILQKNKCSLFSNQWNEAILLENFDIHFYQNPFQKCVYLS